MEDVYHPGRMLTEASTGGVREDPRPGADPSPSESLHAQAGTHHMKNNHSDMSYSRGWNRKDGVVRVNDASKEMNRISSGAEENREAHRTSRKP